MSDDKSAPFPGSPAPPPKQPDPLEDVRKGLGLLFRAARTAVQKLPTEKFEDVVLSGAKEVGRAIENVAETLNKEISRHVPAPKSERPPPADAAKADATPPQDAGGSGASGGDPKAGA